MSKPRALPIAPRFLNEKDAAAYLGISPTALADLRRAGHVRYRKSALEPEPDEYVRGCRGAGRIVYEIKALDELGDRFQQYGGNAIPERRAS